jgi:hypothetical protein
MVWTPQNFEGAADGLMQVSEIAERFGKGILRVPAAIRRFLAMQGITSPVIPRSPAGHVAES